MTHILFNDMNYTLIYSGTIQASLVPHPHTPSTLDGSIQEQKEYIKMVWFLANAEAKNYLTWYHITMKTFMVTVKHSFQLFLETNFLQQNIILFIEMFWLFALK